MAPCARCLWNIDTGKDAYVILWSESTQRFVHHRCEVVATMYATARARLEKSEVKKVPLTLDSIPSAQSLVEVSLSVPPPVSQGESGTGIEKEAPESDQAISDESGTQKLCEMCDLVVEENDEALVTHCARHGMLHWGCALLCGGGRNIGCPLDEVFRPNPWPENEREIRPLLQVPDKQIAAMSPVSWALLSGVTHEQFCAKFKPSPMQVTAMELWNPSQTTIEEVTESHMAIYKNMGIITFFLENLRTPAQIMEMSPTLVLLTSRCADVDFFLEHSDKFPVVTLASPPLKATAFDLILRGVKPECFSQLSPVDAMTLNFTVPVYLAAGGSLKNLASHFLVDKFEASQLAASAFHS